MKWIINAIVIAMCMFLLFGCVPQEQENMTYTEPENVDVIQQEEYQRDENGEINLYYAKEILQKRTAGLELTEIENSAINHFFIDGNQGMALMDAHAIGMQKMVAHIYRTTNGGKYWDMLDEQLYFMSGAYNCVDIDGKLVISNFASVTQTNAFIIIDIDGNIQSVTADELSAEGELSGLYAEMKLQENGEVIICNWIKDYNSENIVYVSRHDKNLALIDLKKYE